MISTVSLSGSPPQLPSTASPHRQSQDSQANCVWGLALVLEGSIEVIGNGYSFDSFEMHKPEILIGIKKVSYKCSAGFYQPVFT